MVILARRHLRRLASIPLVEQVIRRGNVALAVRRGRRRPADSLVTSLGHGTLRRSDLPSVGSRSFDRLARRAARSKALVVDEQASIDGAASVAELARRGVPLHRARDAMEPSIAPARPGSQAPVRGDDHLERYVRSVRLARGALADVDRPTLSVLLATKRPTMLEHAVRGVASQRGADVQLVAGLHGDWPGDTEHRLRELWPGELVVVNAAASVTLGRLLNELVARADGPLVTKWDDDDWYGPDHVVDLAIARAGSGAQLVGKAAEFVRLEASDVTIRRPALGARTFTSNIAGGTLTIAREDLLDMGGFADVPRSVDRLLIDECRSQSGAVYRAHGLQYVLRRGVESGHTWNAGDQYFLDQAIERRPGLDLEFADICHGGVSEPT